MTHAVRSLILAALVVLGLVAGLGERAEAQPYARFAVPDSALPQALRAGRTDYESAWNALLVSEIRAQQAHADSARRLARLARDLAGAEAAALGSRIGPDALALRRRWNKSDLRARVSAAVAESLAAVARGRREFDRADSLLAYARDTYRALGERRRLAWALGSLGANMLVAGRHPQAAVYYDAALTARRALGDSVLIANTLNDLGQTYYQLSRFSESFAALHEACTMREAMGRWVQLGNTLNFLGLVMAARGQPDSAIAYYRRSVELTSAGGDSARTMQGLKNFALVLYERGRFDEAMRVSERALVIARAANAVDDMAMIERNLGNLDRIAGRYGQAIERFERAAAGFESVGNDRDRVFALNLEGLALTATGDAERAGPVLTLALALADSSGDPILQASVLNSMALSVYDRGDVPEARRLATRGFEVAAAAFDTTAIHDAAALLGYFAQEHGDLVEAERWHTRATAAGTGMRPEVRANDLSALGVVHQLLGRFDEAERDHRAALRIAEEARSANQVTWSLCNLGDVAERRRDYAAAFAAYGRALAMADTMRTLQGAERGSVKAFASRLFMFDAMIHLLGKLDAQNPDSGYAARAFEWAERSRARAFLDQVTASGQSVAGAPIVTLLEAQRLLDPKREALLVYSVGDSSTSLWVLRRERWRRFTLPARPALKARVQTLRRALADPASSVGAAGMRASRALYGMLIAPAESLLVGVDRLFVAPDGPLSLIPFEALLAREVSGGDVPPRGAYLAERFAISYTPSASVLATRAAATSDSVLVAIGNPAFGTESGAAATPLAPLPSTADEIAAIRSLAGRRRVVALTGSEASRERVLALPELARAGVLHIATHGDVNESEPDHSGLWLAPEAEGGPPTRVEVADIMRTPLTASLVTLSACETGLGRLENGEGVIGLSRAFMVAGAQNVVVSLWPVNDRSTARFMERFYQGALGGRESRVQALAAAKRALLADPETRAPYYWAPFIMVGRSAAPAPGGAR